MDVFGKAPQNPSLPLGYGRKDAPPLGHADIPPIDQANWTQDRIEFESARHKDRLSTLDDRSTGGEG